MSLGSLYRSRKSKDKFVNQPHPKKIEKTRPFFVKIQNSIFQLNYTRYKKKLDVKV